MSTIQKVAVAGASGQVGKPVVHELVAAGFEVTVLTRQGSSATFPSNIRVAKVDYESVESLTAALEGQDALVSAVTTEAVGSQTKLVDAAVAAGVKRILPSEFGADESLKTIQSLPMYYPKLEVQEYTKQKTAGTGTSYSFVYTNGFWDWGLDFGFYVDLKKKSIKLYDGGDFEFVTTPLDFVGRAVAAILRHPEETANREVRIAGGRISQKEVLALAQKVLGSDGWSVEEVSTAAEERKALDNFKQNPADVYGWIVGLVSRGQFGEGYSRTYKSDNDVLGLKELTVEELGEYIHRAVKSGSAGKQY